MGFSALFSFVVIIVLSETADSDYLPIRWNVSTDIGHSRDERLYEHLMFADVAPADCDLTENVCDSGCCSDPDCDDKQRKTFNCSDEDKSCSRPFSRFDCNCDSDNPFWFPMLCYVFENPIYLGVFYRTLAKIENLKDFLASTYLGRYKYRTVEKVSDGKSYVFGSKVLAFMPQNGSYMPHPHALLHEDNMLSGLSLDCRIPVKYMKNQTHSCYVSLTKEKCKSGISLGAKPYLLRNANSTDANGIPGVLKNLQTEQTAVVSIILKSSSANYVIKNFKGQAIKYFYANNNTSDHGYNTNLLETAWTDSVCCNIVAQAVFRFVTNASEIEKIEIQLHLTNVSISNQLESVYLKRVHDVSFIDVNTGSESDDDNFVFNRGYYIGENLNFGYIRENGSHSIWEKGQLEIFVTGRSCDRSRGITFGYNTYSVCVHPIPISSCRQIREEITRKLDLLTSGDYLAPYGTYKDTRRSAIPLLRAYDRTELSNNTDCLIPIQQDMVIQYTKSITPSGFPVYEAVGAMINRTFANLTNVDGVLLTVRVLFVDVTSPRKKALSRFWERIYSPEESENAWLNIFKVFDRPISDRELEESTFWFLLPVIIVFTTFIILRDFH